jgi:hypothetical protein
MEYKTSEAEREYMRRYKEMNREEINARRRASVKEKEAKKKWYQEHKEQINERGRENTNANAAAITPHITNQHTKAPENTDFGYI